MKVLTKMVYGFKKCLVRQYKTFEIFRAQFPSEPDFFSAKVYKLFDEIWLLTIDYFSIFVLASVEYSRFHPIVYKSLLGRTSWIQTRQSATSGVFQYLNT